MLSLIIKFVHFVEIFHEIINPTEHTLGLTGICCMFHVIKYTFSLTTLFLLKYFELLTLSNKKYIFQSGWLPIG